MFKIRKTFKVFFAESYDGKNPENESFVHFTMENRFPKIFREHWKIVKSSATKDIIRRTKVKTETGT